MKESYLQCPSCGAIAISDFPLNKLKCECCGNNEAKYNKDLQDSLKVEYNNKLQANQMGKNKYPK